MNQQLGQRTFIGGHMGKIEISGNSGDDIAGDLIRIEALPPGMEVSIRDNAGADVRGHLINIILRVPEQELQIAMAKIESMAAAMSADHRCTIERIAGEIRHSTEPEFRVRRLQFLYDFAVGIGASGIVALLQAAFAFK